MYGRYGADEFYKFLMSVWIVLVMMNFILRNAVIGAAVTALLVYMYFRVLSKNIGKRRRENEIYLKISEPFRSFLRISVLKFRDRKTHCYRKCPHCKKMLRLPKRKGKHSVCCPQCKNNFDVKI